MKKALLSLSILFTAFTSYSQKAPGGVFYLDAQAQLVMPNESTLQPKYEAGVNMGLVYFLGKHVALGGAFNYSKVSRSSQELSPNTYPISSSANKYYTQTVRVRHVSFGPVLRIYQNQKKSSMFGHLALQGRLTHYSLEFGEDNSSPVVSASNVISIYPSLGVGYRFVASEHFSIEVMPQGAVNPRTSHLTTKTELYLSYGVNVGMNFGF